MNSLHRTVAAARQAARVTLGIATLAAAAAANPQDGGPADEPMTKWMAVLAGMAVLPLLLTMITPFAKLVVVGSMLRQALGTQNIPPTSVITGLALILTIGIVSPVASDVWSSYNDAKTKAAAAGQAPPEYELFLRAAKDPCRQFLLRNAQPENIELFVGLQRQRQEQYDAQRTSAHGADHPQAKLGEELEDALEILTVLAPAFMLTELAEAFWIAALLFIPMLVIDLVVSNVLLAMGMQMMVPSTIALPIKVIVFVIAGGWKLLFQGLFLSYQ